MPQQPYATVGLGSNNTTLPQATINVASTLGFPTPPAGGSYTINVFNGPNGVNSPPVQVNYTGLMPTSFTGCTLGSGKLATGQVIAPAATQPPGTTLPPQNTFFRHNSANNNNPTAADAIVTLDVPFDWLVQLDRPVVNALELMHVSAFPQNQLTQQFITYNNGTNTTTKFQHYAPWLDHSAMIYRALELLGVPSYLTGADHRRSGSGPDQHQHAERAGDLPGPLRRQRSRGRRQQLHLHHRGCADPVSRPRRVAYAELPVGPPMPSALDRPFRSFAAGWIRSGADTQQPAGSGIMQYQLGSGLNDTLLRSGMVSGTKIKGMLQVPAGSAVQANTHPYQRCRCCRRSSTTSPRRATSSQSS